MTNTIGGNEICRLREFALSVATGDEVMAELLAPVGVGGSNKKFKDLRGLLRALPAPFSASDPG